MRGGEKIPEKHLLLSLGRWEDKKTTSYPLAVVGTCTTMVVEARAQRLKERQSRDFWMGERGSRIGACGKETQRMGQESVTSRNCTVEETTAWSVVVWGSQVKT
mmetsp:Transcript_25020/g.63139  ORF Transcript_25020/g.63139 Transcript_25020/m.63139 type:complete len:104 (-) Transcript_25020:420-731(-)